MLNKHVSQCWENLVLASIHLINIFKLIFTFNLLQYSLMLMSPPALAGMSARVEQRLIHETRAILTAAIVFQFFIIDESVWKARWSVEDRQVRHFTQKNRLEELRRRRNEGRSYDRVQLLWLSGSTLGHGFWLNRRTRLSCWGSLLDVLPCLYVEDDSLHCSSRETLGGIGRASKQPGFKPMTFWCVKSWAGPVPDPQRPQRTAARHAVLL